MPHVYKNILSNFTGIEHFIETAIKTLNELFGRDEPLDDFDYAQGPDGQCVMIGYKKGEAAAVGISDQKQGEPLSDQNAAKVEAITDIAKTQCNFVDHTEEGPAPFIDDNFLLGSNVQPATFKLSDGSELQLGEIVRRAKGISGLQTAKEWNALTDDQREVFIAGEVAKLDLYDADKDDTVDDDINATDAAFTYAQENGIDLKAVTGTGKDGRIGKPDVDAFIKAQAVAAQAAADAAKIETPATADNAPAQENADDKPNSIDGADNAGASASAGSDTVS